MIEHDPPPLIEQRNAAPLSTKTAVKVKGDDNEEDLDIDAI